MRFIVNYRVIFIACLAMKYLSSLLLALALAPLATVRGADAKTYQVTGPVIEITETTITVQKEDQKWELARDKKTKGSAKVKVGDKVTVYYRMVAEEVETKDATKSEKVKTEKK